MSLLKPLHYKLNSYYIVVMMASIVLSAILVSIHPAKAQAATDCSDVFTPLSSYVTTGVAANKSFYVRAMNETGVPWELLAAIHYRETNFSHSNPGNGQGIFQFVNGEGGPYPPGAVSDDNFYSQLRFMANKIQTDYAFRGSLNRERRKLVPNEQNMAIVKDTIFSYNGRSSAYASQAASYGFNSSTQPYEGSPYVMNRFDCQRARMGIITRDYGSIDGTDTRYGAFTIFARLRGESFWLLLTRAYSWEMATQEAYLDPERTKPVDVGNLSTSQKVYMRIKARNLGSSTWIKNGANPVLLATTSPSNRTSGLCDESWINCSRPASQIETTVEPGGIGTFEFSIKTGGIGSTKEYFNLVAEGREWFNDFGLNWQISVNPPTPRWQAVNQQLYTDNSRTKPANIDALSPSRTYYATVSVRNNGNTTWSNTGANPVSFGTSSPLDRQSIFQATGWLGSNRAATLQENSVNPGDIGTFKFAISTPSQLGTYREYFRPVAEGQAWMNDIGFYWPFTVSQPTPLWSVVSQQLYNDSALSSTANPASLKNGTRYYFVIRAMNRGNTTWSNNGINPVRLGTNNPQDRASELYDTSWVGFNRATTLQETQVSPGEIGTFAFWISAPYKNNGTLLSESFRPVTEGQAWMNDIGMYQPFTFSSQEDTWQYMGQGAYNDQAYSSPADLSNASRDTTYYLTLRLKNTSGVTWQQSSFLLGTNNPQDRTSNYYTSSWIGANRAARLKESAVVPGSIGTFEFKIKTPNSAVTSNEYFRPVIEGKTWLTDLGLYWRIVTK